MVRKAQELEEKQRQHQTELSAKEKNLLDQAQIIEAKIQQAKELQVALTERETAKKMVETKLTAAEEEIVDTARELKKSADALTAKERETLAMARDLEEKERAHESTQKRMAQIAGLKAEIENELTAKESIILLQVDKLRQKEGPSLTNKLF